MRINLIHFGLELFWEKTVTFKSITKIKRNQFSHEIGYNFVGRFN